MARHQSVPDNQVDAHRADTGVSRRSIVIGAAWATPMILVATALPAAAASPKVIGGVAFVGSGAVQSETVLTVTTQVFYVGDGAPYADYPVSGLAARISIPTARVAAGAGAVASGAGWSYTSRTTSGTNTLFTFTWNGAALTASQSTTQLVATVPKSTNRTVLAATLTANGTSNGVPIAQATATATAPAIGPKGVLTQNFSNGGMSNKVLTLQNALQWAGPYSPEVGAPIAVQYVEFLLPTSKANGTWSQAAWSGAGWTLGTPTLVGANWRFRASTTQVIQNGSTNTTTLVAQFAMKSNGAGTATIGATGTTANSPVTVSGTLNY